MQVTPFKHSVYCINKKINNILDGEEKGRHFETGVGCDVWGSQIHFEEGTRLQI